MRARPAPTAAATAMTAAMLLAAGGCYQHVVSAKGPGADRYDLHEPSIGKDDSVWAKPSARTKKDETYGLGPGSEVPGQVRKPAGQDN